VQILDTHIVQKPAMKSSTHRTATWACRWHAHPKPMILGGRRNMPSIDALSLIFKQQTVHETKLICNNASLPRDNFFLHFPSLVESTCDQTRHHPVNYPVYILQNSRRKYEENDSRVTSLPMPYEIITTPIIRGLK